MSKRVRQGVPSIKQVLPAEKTIGVRAFVRTPFHTPCPARYSVLHLLGVLSGGNEPPFTQGRLWFVRSESLSVFPDKHCFCGHKSEAPREQKLGYNVIKALKSSVSLIGSKQRLLFKHRMKSSISVISESVTGCSSSISENSGEVNFIVFWRLIFVISSAWYLAFFNSSNTRSYCCVLQKQMALLIELYCRVL